MDEPTSSLTLSETQRLLEIVLDLKAHHVSIIYISHRLHEVEEIADRAVVLRDGRNAGEIRTRRHQSRPHGANDGRTRLEGDVRAHRQWKPQRKL